jgi:hypothetical protein
LSSQPNSRSIVLNRSASVPDHGCLGKDAARQMLRTAQGSIALESLARVDFQSFCHPENWTVAYPTSAAENPGLQRLADECACLEEPATGRQKTDLRLDMQRPQ